MSQNDLDHGIWRSLVARVVRDDEAAGSNPVIPTKGKIVGPSSVELGPTALERWIVERVSRG